MSVERRNFPQFFITAPAPCPYLPEKLERKVFTHLISAEAARLHSTLVQAGFRRSQNIAYRPACDDCAGCVSVRVCVDTFHWTRGFRRVWRTNRDLVAASEPARVSGELYGLFRDYIEARHEQGGMAGMSRGDFAMMVEESFVDTRIFTYRRRAEPSLAGPDGRKGELLAAALSDVLSDGLSMIYSFYAPHHGPRSLGTYMILEHIERARAMGLPYVYLGYWISASRKMAYKSRFLPQQRLGRDGWVTVGERS